MIDMLDSRHLLAGVRERSVSEVWNAAIRGVGRSQYQRFLRK